MRDYNQHARLLSSRVLVSMRCQVYSVPGEEPTLLSNQLDSPRGFERLFSIVTIGCLRPCQRYNAGNTCQLDGSCLKRFPNFEIIWPRLGMEAL
jgi:hypothetical protein